MSEQSKKLEFRTWLHIECLLPFAIVLIIVPAAPMFHKMGQEPFLHLLGDVLAGGELPAVAFCLLLPTFIIGIQHDVSMGVLITVAIGGLFAFLTYAACKIEPPDPSEGPLADLLLMRGGVSMVLMLSTIFLAKRVRTIALAHALNGS